MTIYDYAEVGGTPIINNALTYYYVQNQDCPFDRITASCACPSLLGLPGGIPESPTIQQAPWYDPSQPDLSSRFFGVYGWSFTGLGDTNRSTQIVEGLDDGAWMGRTRRTARQVRVEGMLIAKGQDALDYGLAWLSAALDGDRCGQHSAACGVTDFEFFTACPPPRGEMPDFTPWTESRRNLAFGVPGVILATRVNDVEYDGDTWYQFTATGQPGGMRASVPAATPGSTYTFSAEVANPGATPVTLSRISWSDQNLQSVTLAPGERRVVTSTGNSPTLNFADVRADNGQTFLVRLVTVTAGPADPIPFNGDSEDSDLARYSWAGAPNASQSIEETREPSERPETDAEYAASVDPLRRYLHEVVCTSGPLKKRESAREDWNMMDVEFTLTAGRPWIFEAMRHPDLPTTATTVIEDTAHNLVPYTSAELGGALLPIARNYTANPSVETNATGWGTGVSGAITAGMVTSGRVTGELAANGAASFRAVFTATGASAVAGDFYIQQEVDVSARPAGAPVSINMWAAEVLMAGAPVRTDIQFVAYWRAVAGGAILRTDNLGTVPVDGGANSVRSLIPPAGANFVLVRARAPLSSWPAGTILRLYADALAVTVP